MNNNRRRIIFSFNVYTEDPQHLNTSFQKNDDFEYEHAIRVRDLGDEIRLLFVSPFAGSKDAYLEKNGSVSMHFPSILINIVLCPIHVTVFLSCNS